MGMVMGYGGSGPRAAPVPPSVRRRLMPAISNRDARAACITPTTPRFPPPPPLQAPRGPPLGRGHAPPPARYTLTGGRVGPRTTFDLDDPSPSQAAHATPAAAAAAAAAEAAESEELLRLMYDTEPPLQRHGQQAGGGSAGDDDAGHEGGGGGGGGGYGGAGYDPYDAPYPQPSYGGSSGSGRYDDCDGDEEDAAAARRASAAAHAAAAAAAAEAAAAAAEYRRLQTAQHQRQVAQTRGYWGSGSVYDDRGAAAGGGGGGGGGHEAGATGRGASGGGPPTGPGGEPLLPVAAVLPAAHAHVLPYSHLTAVQSRAFDAVYHSDASVALAAPTGAGKTGVFELAILRLLASGGSGGGDDAAGTPSPSSSRRRLGCKVVYLCPSRALCAERLDDWRAKFGRLGLTVVSLTGDNDVGGGGEEAALQDSDGADDEGGEAPPRATGSGGGGSYSGRSFGGSAGAGSTSAAAAGGGGAKNGGAGGGSGGGGAGLDHVRSVSQPRNRRGYSEGGCARSLSLAPPLHPHFPLSPLLPHIPPSSSSLPAQADIIVATPEKWDAATRRLRDNTGLVGQIGLLLIDEVCACVPRVAACC
jgi:hypothetical protein